MENLIPLELQDMVVTMKGFKRISIWKFAFEEDIHRKE